MEIYKNAKKVAFLTTIFPIKDEYLFDFFDSLESQSFKNFDTIVVNDGYKNFDKIKTKYNNLNIIELNYSNTPAKNREYGINYCIEQDYDILIFGDCDDYFSLNRVEKTLELLFYNDIVVNDLTLFDQNGVYEEKYFSNRLNNNTIIEFDFIKEKNIFGLSNTGIKLHNIHNIKIDKDLIAVDWYIFSMLLLENKKAIFTNEAISYYRQYQQNTIGLKELDEISFNKSINIKKRHYSILAMFGCDFNLESKELPNTILDIEENINHPLWWELIKRKHK